MGARKGLEGRGFWPEVLYRKRARGNPTWLDAEAKKPWPQVATPLTEFRSVLYGPGRSLVRDRRSMARQVDLCRSYRLLSGGAKAEPRRRLPSRRNCYFF